MGAAPGKGGNWDRKGHLTILIVLSLFLTMIPLDYSLTTSGFPYSKHIRLEYSDASYWGELELSNIARTLSSAGDINGDGIDDLMAGVPVDAHSEADGGMVYFFFGRSAGWLTDEYIKDTNASINGSNYLGISISKAGDVNGDGYDDIVLGEPYQDNGQTNLMFGGPDGWKMYMDHSVMKASFNGELDDQDSGYSVSGVGDVNGDGYCDIMMGGFWGADGVSPKGQAYLVLGSPNHTGEVSVTSSDVTFFGGGNTEYGVWTVAGVGDVNGDELDDFMIGVAQDDTGDTDVGESYLFLGRTDWEKKVNVYSANASFIGEGAGDCLGSTISGAGDVNGDGYDDILFGVMNHDEGGTNVGKTYMIFGRSAGWSMNQSISTSDASFVGEAAGDKAGSSVSSAGDVNGDGLDDILIGAPGNDFTASNAGQTYLILGRATGLTNDMPLSSADASFVGDSADDGSGSAVTGAGDLNQDGFDDIAISAPMNMEFIGNSGQIYMMFPDTNKPPSGITSVQAFSDIGYTNAISTIDIGSRVYIEVRGTDGDASRGNVVVAKVASSMSSPIGIHLKLLETGVNTGIFRGSYLVTNRTNEEHQFIKSIGGENLTITPVLDPSKNKTIVAIGPLSLGDIPDRTILERAFYKERPIIEGWVSGIWEIDTNATWLSWNQSTQTLSGTPGNGDVGGFFVHVKVSSGYGQNDELTYNILVLNVAPTILTSNVLSAKEDEPYHVDYNSTDDGQGMVAWHLETNAGSWLNLSTSSGELNGTLGNESVGTYDVNISVDDGNGGTNFTRFKLNVSNINDRPLIIGTDNKTAFEDVPYEVRYTAYDGDPNSTFFWDFVTNATDWLRLESKTGTLSGVPAQRDLGDQWVNLSVADADGAMDMRNFTITVVATNHPPSFESLPPTEWYTLIELEYDLVVTDKDAGDVPTCTLDEGPEGMVLTKEPMRIEWTPRKDQSGSHKVAIRASDGKVSVYQNFTINVTIPDNYPSFATLVSPQNGFVVNITRPQLEWTFSDLDDSEVLFDVYLGLDKEAVDRNEASARMGSNLTQTRLIPDEGLSRGDTYYWTVVPHAGSLKGICTSGTWWFNVSLDAIVYTFLKIISEPVKEAYVGMEYRYRVVTEILDNLAIRTYSLIEGPTGMTIDQIGLINWTPAKDQVGTHKVTIMVSDNIMSVNQSFNIEVIGSGGGMILVTPVPDQKTEVGEEFTLQLVVTSVVPGGETTYKLTKGPRGLSLSPAGLVRWVPGDDQIGMHNINISISSGHYNTSVEFDIEVTEGGSEEGTEALNGTTDGILTVVVCTLALTILIAVALKYKRHRKG